MPLTARDAIRAVVDPGTFQSWDEPFRQGLGAAPSTEVPSGAGGSGAGGSGAGGSGAASAGFAASADYSAELASAASRSGSDEAVLTGEAIVGGVRAALLAWEFRFLGGSVGVRTATRIVSAIRRATDERLPLLAMPRSGGTRMQEGSPAFVQMIAITGALSRHRAKGLPYLVHLCGPTTGGVLATLGSAGDLTTAEPGAMVGFLGPRAVAAITGRALDDGVQVAENLAGLGIIDEVLEWEGLAQRWRTLLRLVDQGAGDRPLRPPSAGVEIPGMVAPAGAGIDLVADDRAADAEVAVGGGGEAAAAAPGGGEAAVSEPGGMGDPAAAPGSRAGSPAHDPAHALWADVQATRSTARPDARTVIDAHMSDVVTIPGTQSGQRARGALVVIGRLRGRPVVVAATGDRLSGESLDVAGLRTIRRGIELAGRWGLPLVTIVDTLGAALSVPAEESGIAGEISRVMLDLVSSPSPTAALLLGAGTGGAALALLATDRIVAGSRAWLAPLAPEGAAAIRHGGSHDPAAVALQQRIGARALADLGFIDVVVDESDPGWVGAATQAVLASLPDRLPDRGQVPDLDQRMGRFEAWR